MRMRRRITTLLAAASIAGLATATGAATVRLSDRPQFVDHGTKLEVRGALQNLMSGGATVAVRARGLARIVCMAPGTQDSSARNSRSVVVVANASQTLSSVAVASSTASFAMTVGPPTLASSAAAGCPSDRWAARIDHVDFRSVTIRVTQAGRVVLEQTLRP